MRCVLACMLGVRPLRQRADNARQPRPAVRKRSHRGRDRGLIRPSRASARTKRWPTSLPSSCHRFERYGFGSPLRCGITSAKEKIAAAIADWILKII